jgi:very-short-patch-repair endonuclease
VLPSRTEADPALFIALCQQHGLPEPVAEYRFAAPRRWRFDFAWPDRRVALEVEGGAFSQGRHVRGKGYKADCEKYSEAAALGWRLLRVLPSQLCTAETISLIRRTMALTQNGAAIGELPLPATTVENSGTLGVT